MNNCKPMVLGIALAFASAPIAFAQETAAPVDCAADFATLDADANGYLSETEAPRAYARSRSDGVTVADTGLALDGYVALCGNTAWTMKTPEVGAPFEGANSFTENQARDRAVARNVTDVSPLTMDDAGIWRGTGKADGAAVSVAIDFKGNVVTSPAQP